MKKIVLSFIIMASLCVWVSAASAAGAEGAACKQSSDCTAPATCVGGKCATEAESVPCDPSNPNKGQCIKLVNPLKGDTVDINVILGSIIRYVLGFVGALTLFMLVWGAFQWLVSAGNAERIKKGTDTMLWAVIGVILVFSSYIILTTFTNYLIGK